MVHIAGADVGTSNGAEVSPFRDRDAAADPDRDGRRSAGAGATNRHDPPPVGAGWEAQKVLVPAP